jgi:hypothetical protein
MSEQEKKEVEEEMYMQYHYDEFIDDNPVVQERIAKAEARAIARGEAQGRVLGEARGEARGKVLGLQQSALNILSLRFPDLMEPAQQIIGAMQDTDELDQLIKQLIIAPDAQAVCSLLHLPIHKV